MPAVSPIPEGYPRLSPYLAVDDAATAIHFYCTVLGATERMRMPAPDGKIGHAELEFGDSVIMLADEFPDQGHRSPTSVGGTSVGLSLYVDDVDAVYAAAIAAGASGQSEPADQFYGDRTGSFEDPFGHRWHVMTHIEDVSAEEMAARAEKMSAEG